MNIAILILIAFYASLLTFILVYSFVQASLVMNYLRFHRNKAKTEEPETKVLTEFPFITVQLPVYNEKYVVERLIDSIAALDYPKSRLEIQVLDDSTDETVDIARSKVNELSQNGVLISHIYRSNRVGYKAGALDEGLKIAKGEFIVIFDSDFLPNPEFLQMTIPHFEDERIGVVQTRWEHLNREYSWLTRLQAFGLDAHFSIEQTGRNAGGHFINFNGTAGVWRKKCIEDAGGWSADTLTEDLDLSYRAQLRGWKFSYLENVGSPAELPALIDALKTQQFRWTKGAAECARKNLKKVLVSDEISLSTKVHSVFHLMNSFLFVCIALSAIISIPLLFIKTITPDLDWLFKLGSVFMTSFVILAWFYAVSFFKRLPGTIKSTFDFLITFPLFLAVSMGLSLHNSIAVVEGYLGIKSPFIRTPKMNLVNKSDDWNGNNYLASKISVLTIFEGLLMLYFIMGIYLGIHFGDYGLMPFHIMLSVGFGYVFFSTIIQSKSIRGNSHSPLESKIVGV